jgi:ribosomal protein L32
VGLSFTQILFTIVVAVAVWRVVGFLERKRRLRRPAREDQAAVEVAKCPRCGTYVPTGEPCPHCERRAARGG